MKEKALLIIVIVSMGTLIGILAYGIYNFDRQMNEPFCPPVLNHSCE